MYYFKMAFRKLKSKCYDMTSATTRYIPYPKRIFFSVQKDDLKSLKHKGIKQKPTNNKTKPAHRQTIARQREREEYGWVS